MDLSGVIGRRRLVEQDALRILLIVHELGHPAGLDGYHCVLETEVYLQKVDYLVRNPSALAVAIMRRFQEAERSANRAAVMADVRRLYGAKEPRLRRIGMQKFRFGPWERLDDTLSYLSCRKLLTARQRTGRGCGVNYLLTTNGAAFVDAVKKEHPELDYYTDKCRLISRHLDGVTGTALKDFLYKVLSNVAATPLGKVIASHGEEVPVVFQDVFGEAL